MKFFKKVLAFFLKKEPYYIILCIGFGIVLIPLSFGFLKPDTVFANFILYFSTVCVIVGLIGITPRLILFFKIYFKEEREEHKKLLKSLEEEKNKRFNC